MMPSDPSAGGSSQPSSHVERPHKPFATRPELRVSLMHRRHGRVESPGSPCFRGAHLPGGHETPHQKKKRGLKEELHFFYFEPSNCGSKGKVLSSLNAQPTKHRLDRTHCRCGTSGLGWSNSPEHPLDYHQTCLMYVISYT